MCKILLIADDLTGALDSGVAFAAPDRRVLVARTVREARALIDENPDVLAVSTGTRDGSPESAAAAMAELCRQIDPTAFEIVMKKVDSRLKGHIKAETAVLADALADRPLVAAPAIPSMGRVQRNGAIEGQDIPEPIAVAPLFDRTVYVPDLESDEDLDAVVSSGGPVLWVGARGLAFALARHSFRNAAPPTPVLHRSILLAIGSRDPVTLAQVSELRRVYRVHGAPDGTVGIVPSLGDVTVIQMTEGGSGRTARDAGEEFADGITSCARARMPATVLTSGGETANALLVRLGIDRLELIAEIAPGLPVAEIQADWGTCRVVTKSGGFGHPDLLSDIVLGCAPRDTGVIAT